jgi:hypothetical protein
MIYRNEQSGVTQMAKVSAHGTILATVEYMTYAKRYMSDGVILKNQGFGWKLHGKVKPGVPPQDVANRAVEHLAQQKRDKPAVAAYSKALHNLAGLNKRWKLHAAVQLMPDDCDGVWSECCDGYGDNVHADIDDVAELCRLYQRMVASRDTVESVV